jgi:hypothetical protein
LHITVVCVWASLSPARAEPLYWSHKLTGDNAVWSYLPNSTSLAYTTGTTPCYDMGWEMVGTGRFNGDVKPDILWHYQDGRCAVWFMDGPNFLGSSFLSHAQPDTRWQIVGAADFDGNGTADILWR